MAGSASTFPSQNFQVFINHRGPDAKDSFATPLYRTLTESGLLVFLDKPEMQVGHDIDSQIEAAIQVASVHVAIFSPRYAESKWCLNELLWMLGSKKPIIPVFYKVKPQDLRWTTWTGTERDGPYAKTLHKHEEEKRHNIQTIELWRKALSDVAKKSGLELETFDGDEEEPRRQEELLGKVVQSVLKIVPPPLNVAKYPTGLGGKLEEFERTLLSEQQREHRKGAMVVGIVGLGGIGKTTLATHFFNIKRSEYSMSSLLFDVRENAKTGLNSLQIKLGKQLKHRDIKIERWEEGTEILKIHLSSSHALIIIDNVDHIDQLNAFLPIRDVLDPKSLILVTSRDRGVLIRAKIVESSIYHLGGLSKAHSEQLFCSYAFSQQVPLPGFEILVKRFIKACHGLPLSLKVLGALLYGTNDHSYWTELLDGLAKLLPDDIQKSLRISYDSLNPEEKQIFLDIACFGIGEDRDKWVRIWGGSGWKGLVGFRNLQNKCLVDLKYGSCIIMHDHLRDMGRNIADSSIPRRLWQRTRTFQDINDRLEGSSSAITEVRRIRMGYDDGIRFGYDDFESPVHILSHELLGMRKLQLLKARDNYVESILTRVDSPKLIWLCWHHCPYASLPSRIPMHYLRVLELNSYTLRRLWEPECPAPLQLRELIIDASLVEFPKDFWQLKHLEKIEARVTSLATFPDDFNLPSLKYLKLHGCKFQRLWQGEYGAPQQLRELIIDAPLVEFPKAFWQLKNLETVKARNTSLATISEELNLPSLKYIELHGCKFQRSFQCESGAPQQLWELFIDAPLVEFPKALVQWKHLEKIEARNTSLATFPEDFNLPSLKYLSLRGCKFQRLWQGEHGAPQQLRELIIDAPLVEFPKAFGQLKHLETIVARNTSLATISEELNLPSLKSIELHGFKFQRSSQCESGAPQQLWELNINAPLVEFPKAFAQLKHLEKIEAWNTSLATFPDDFNLPSLKYLTLHGCKLKELPCDLKFLSNLEVLRVGSRSLEVLLPSVDCLRNLKQLWLHKCEKLQCLPDSVQLLSQLTELKIWKCGIQYLPPAVMKMKNLKVLAVCHCPLRELPFKSLSLELSLASPSDSSVNEGMFELQELHLYRVEVSEISFPEGVCPNLQNLRIVRCEHLVKVGALPTPLRNLNLGYCGELRKIRGIYGVTKLENLNMRGCNNIDFEELQGLGTLISAGLKLSRFQTEHLEDDSSVEQSVFSEPFCRKASSLWWMFF